ncbi:MAG: SMP-30/gluconolactonase/LRE family protein [Erythrobacter sp.]
MARLLAGERSVAEAIGFLAHHRCRLGESPVWDAAGERLWWVDSAGQSIHAARANGEPLAQWNYDSMIGSIGLAEGGLVAGFADHVALVDGASGKAARFAAVPGHDGTMRLNDGKVDRAGTHYICGQTRMAEDASGTLFQLSNAGALAPLADGMRISNAICFSPDGTTLYFADSLDGVIRCLAYDPASGEVGAQTDTISLAGIGQAPDGATVDADGNLWIALVLDQAIACVSPSGALLRRVAMPMPYPSCPAFGGAGLETLFVTSIANSGHMLVTDHPDGGRIAVVTGLGVRGIAECRFQAGAA